MIGRGEMRRWEEEKNRTEEKERTEEMRIGNDCLGRGEEDERKGRDEDRRVGKKREEQKRRGRTEEYSIRYV